MTTYYNWAASRYQRDKRRRIIPSKFSGDSDNGPQPNDEGGFGPEPDQWADYEPTFRVSTANSPGQSESTSTPGTPASEDRFEWIVDEYVGPGATEINPSPLEPGFALTLEINEPDNRPTNRQWEFGLKQTDALNQNITNVQEYGPETDTQAYISLGVSSTDKSAYALVELEAKLYVLDDDERRLVRTYTLIGSIENILPLVEENNVSDPPAVTETPPTEIPTVQESTRYRIVLRGAFDVQDGVVRGSEYFPIEDDYTRKYESNAYAEQGTVYKTSEVITKEEAWNDENVVKMRNYSSVSEESQVLIFGIDQTTDNGTTWSPLLNYSGNQGAPGGLLSNYVGFDWQFKWRPIADYVGNDPTAGPTGNIVQRASRLQLEFSTGLPPWSYSYQMDAEKSNFETTVPDQNGTVRPTFISPLMPYFRDHYIPKTDSSYWALAPNLRLIPSMLQPEVRIQIRRPSVEYLQPGSLLVSAYPVVGTELRHTHLGYNTFDAIDHYVSSASPLGPSNIQQPPSTVYNPQSGRLHPTLYMGVEFETLGRPDGIASSDFPPIITDLSQYDRPDEASDYSAENTLYDLSGTAITPRTGEKTNVSLTAEGDGQPTYDLTAYAEQGSLLESYLTPNNPDTIVDGKTFSADVQPGETKTLSVISWAVQPGRTTAYEATIVYTRLGAPPPPEPSLTDNVPTTITTWDTPILEAYSERNVGGFEALEPDTSIMMLRTNETVPLNHPDYRLRFAYWRYDATGTGTPDQSGVQVRSELYPSDSDSRAVQYQNMSIRLYGVTGAGIIVTPQFVLEGTPGSPAGYLTWSWAAETMRQITNRGFNAVLLEFSNIPNNPSVTSSLRFSIQSRIPVDNYLGAQFVTARSALNSALSTGSPPIWQTDPDPDAMTFNQTTTGYYVFDIPKNTIVTDYIIMQCAGGQLIYNTDDTTFENQSFTGINSLPYGLFKMPASAVEDTGTHFRVRVTRRPGGNGELFGFYTVNYNP